MSGVDSLNRFNIFERIESLTSCLPSVFCDLPQVNFVKITQINIVSCGGCL